MAEYINREAAIRALLNDSPEQVSYSREDAADCIRYMDADDVVPVRHGEWIVCGDGDNVPWMCSHCGKTTASKYKIMYGKYCPNCGQRWMVAMMTDFYFTVGSDPRDVFVVVGEKWILYKHCETEEIARAIVNGQNNSRIERLEQGCT